MSGWLFAVGVTLVDVAAYIAPRAYARFCDGIADELAFAINYGQGPWYDPHLYQVRR